MKHHQINEKLSFINVEYHLVFQLQFAKKWLVYLKIFYWNYPIQNKHRIATPATLSLQQI